MSVSSLAEYDANCTACGRERLIVEPSRDWAVASRCEACFETCPNCEGFGFVFETNDSGYEFSRTCPVCGALDERIRRFNEAQIPQRYAGPEYSFEAYRGLCYEGGDSKRPAIGNLVEVHTRLNRWLRPFVPGEKGLVLAGPVGTGKTHLLAAIVRDLTLKKGVRCRFVEFTHLLGDIREQYDQGRGEAAVLAPVVEVPVLAIDELGKGHRTEWQMSIIDQIISKRYNRGLTTLATTNYVLDGARPASKLSDLNHDGFAPTETLRERIGDRVHSRLFEMAEFVEIDARDFRRSSTGR